MDEELQRVRNSDVAEFNVAGVLAVRGKEKGEKVKIEKKEEMEGGVCLGWGEE